MWTGKHLSHAEQWVLKTGIGEHGFLFALNVSNDVEMQEESATLFNLTVHLVVGFQNKNLIHCYKKRHNTDIISHWLPGVSKPSPGPLPCIY